MKKSALIMTFFAAFTAGSAVADTLGADAQPNSIPQAPALKIVFACGECNPNDSVEPLIQGAYLDAAKKAGLSVDETDKVTFTITDYRERSTMARIIGGVLAGSDKIEGKLSWRDTQADVSDTAISTLNGIEAVARNVGEDALRKIAQALPKPNDAANLIAQ